MSGSEGRRSGVLIMGYGGPDSLDAVAPFMRNLTGQEPSEELLDRVRMRYLAIGGSSPLTSIAGELAEGLEKALSEEGLDVPVAIGMRYWHPFIAEGVRSLAEAGVQRVIGVSLSPFEARITCGAYRIAVEDAIAEYPELEFVEAPSIATLDEFAELAAAAVAYSAEELDDWSGSLIVFTAHSLPESDLQHDDQYVSGLREVVDRVVSFLTLEPGHTVANEPRLPGIEAYGDLTGESPWVFAYQSAGQKPGPWLGPDIGAVIDAELEGGFNAIRAIPVGFVTDHMETLYDLDIVAAGHALDIDLEFVRGPVANAHEHLVKGIVSLVAPLI